MLERCIVICIDCYFGGEENIMKRRKEKKQNKAEEQDRLSFPVFYFVSLRADREPVVKLCVRFCPAIQAEVTLKGKHGTLYIFHFLLF